MLISGCPGRKQDVGKSQNRVALAKDFLRQGELEQAENEARKALEYHRGHGDAHYVLGLVDLLRSRSTHKLLEIEQCLTGVDAQALLEEKDRFLIEADRHLSAACKNDAQHGEAWATRGTIATLLGRYDDAISHYEQALQLPNRLQNIGVVRANLGWVYFHKDDTVSAAKELLQAGQFQPGMCLATYRLGRVYFARKEWEKALQTFSEVVGPLRCPIQDAHLFIMKTYNELGVATEIPAAERACIQMAPKSCVALQCRRLGASFEVGRN